MVGGDSVVGGFLLPSFAIPDEDCCGDDERPFDIGATESDVCGSVGFGTKYFKIVFVLRFGPAKENGFEPQFFNIDFGVVGGTDLERLGGEWFGVGGE